MKIVKLENGNVRISSTAGIIDTRTGKIHSVVICRENEAKYFAEAAEK